MPPVKERALSNFFSPSQNHLILIVGLIALACLITGTALAFASPHLDSGQRWVLTAFLILFPVFGVGISVWLILWHHRKLTVGEADDEIRWTLTDPVDQRKKLNAEVIELGAALGIPAQQIGDLRSAFIVAEDLALRQIEHDARTPLLRHIDIGDASFDALLVNDDLVTAIEVTFLVKPVMTQDKIDAILKKTRYAVNKLQELRPGSEMRLLLAVVTQLDEAEDARVRSILEDRFSQSPIDADVSFMDFEKLQREFAAD
jgi:hypothetical protein